MRRPTYGEEEKGLAPLPFALAYALTLEDGGAALPLSVRLGLASFLRRYEPHPQKLTEGAKKAHLMGLMAAGKLTPEGVRAAVLALTEDLTPPSNK